MFSTTDTRGRIVQAFRGALAERRIQELEKNGLLLKGKH
jgi:hypothetical protein